MSNQSTQEQHFSFRTRRIGLANVGVWVCKKFSEIQGTWHPRDKNVELLSRSCNEVHIKSGDGDLLGEGIDSVNTTYFLNYPLACTCACDYMRTVV